MVSFPTTKQDKQDYHQETCGSAAHWMMNCRPEPSKLNVPSSPDAVTVPAFQFAFAPALPLSMPSPACLPATVGARTLPEICTISTLNRDGLQPRAKEDVR